MDRIKTLYNNNILKMRSGSTGRLSEDVSPVEGAQQLYFLARFPLNVSFLQGPLLRVWIFYLMWETGKPIYLLTIFILQIFALPLQSLGEGLLHILAL